MPWRGAHPLNVPAERSPPGVHKCLTSTQTPLEAVEDTTQTYVEYLLNLYHADNMVQLPHYFDENKETTVYYLALETLDKIVHLL